VLAATLTMAPIYSFRFASRDKTDRAAQAATFELVIRVGHKSDPPPTRPWSSSLSNQSILWRRIARGVGRLPHDSFGKVNLISAAGQGRAQPPPLLRVEARDRRDHPDDGIGTRTPRRPRQCRRASNSFTSNCYIGFDGKRQPLIVDIRLQSHRPQREARSGHHRLHWRPSWPMRIQLRNGARTRWVTESGGSSGLVEL
jgi:hypothetical protein